MRIAAIALLAGTLALAGCGGEDSITVETEDGGEATFTAESDDGDTTVRISGDDGGSINIDAGENVSVDLPDGWSVYPGAKVVSSVTLQQADGSGVLVIMETEEAAEDMLEFYRKQAEAAGLEIKSEMKSVNTLVIASDANAATTFQFSATRDADKTTGQLLVGSDS